MHIYLDESGFNLIPHFVRTWGLIGRTPVVVHSAKRGPRVNVISAVSSHGDLIFRTYKGKTISGIEIRDFIRHLERMFLGTTIYLYMDGLSAHFGKRVMAFLEKPECQRIIVRKLPAYCPDLNPDEGVWGYLKTRILPNYLIRTTDELVSKIRGGLQRMKRRPGLVKSFLFEALPWDEASRDYVAQLA